MNVCIGEYRFFRASSECSPFDADSSRLQVTTATRRRLSKPREVPSVRLLAVALTVALVCPTPVLAHGGVLDSQGCHTSRKTGDRQCHRGSATVPNSSSGLVSGAVSLVSVTDQPQRAAKDLQIPRKTLQVCRYAAHLTQPPNPVGLQIRKTLRLTGRQGLLALTKHQLPSKAWIPLRLLSSQQVERRLQRDPSTLC